MAEAPPAPARAPRARPDAVRKAAVAVAAVALLAMAGVGASSLLGEPRNSIHEAGPQGLKDWADALRAEGFRVDGLGAGPHALDAAEDPARTVFVVAGVERAYTAGEVAAVLAFVERGGVAVIADDFGFGDRLGEPFGVNFDQRVLRDAAYEANLSLVRVNASLAGTNVTLIANVPTSLGFAPGVPHERLAESGLDSFIDHDGDGVEDPDDTKGPFPVMASVARGQGRAVFVSDPGLLLNGVHRTNGPFLMALAKQALPEGGGVVFDESRHPVGPLGAAVGALLAGEVQATSEAPVAAAVGLSGALLAGLLYLGFRAPEDIAVHRSRLKDAVHATTEPEARLRLQRLAMRAVADANNLGLDAFAAATPPQLAQMARDPLVAQLVRGEPVKASPQECLERIRAVRAPAQGGR